MQTAKTMSTIGIWLSSVAILWSFLCLIGSIQEAEELGSGLSLLWFLTAGYLLAQSIVVRVRINKNS